MAAPARKTPDASALKAVDILEVLAASDGGMTLSEVAQEAGLAKSTCFRVLMALTARHYVVRSETTKRYRVGYRLLQVAGALLDSLHVREVARGYLEELCRTSGETVHLVQLDGTVGVYIEKLETPQAVGLLSRLGKHIPLHATGCGKALLAWQPPGFLERLALEQGLPRRTASTITDSEALRKEMAITRRRGYALDLGENREGVNCVAAPIFDATGACICSVSVAAPAFRFSRGQAEALAPLVMRVADEISARVGYRHALHARRATH